MNRKWVAGLLAGAILFALVGCHAPVEEAPQYEVVDVPRESVTLGYQPEFPSIDAMVALPGDGAVQTMSMSTGASTEIRAVWISYLEMAHLLQGKSESQFAANIANAFDNVKNYGLNTVIVQVRPFGDALYDSQYFPWSYTITGTEGKDPGFDPLAVMVKQAQDRGLRIEAWLNPYRVRAAGNTKPLSTDNQARIWMDAGKSSVTQYDGAISYNPASSDARNLIVNGVVEIVRNYDVDGIHIDDYFYPTTDAAFDKAYYEQYQKDGGGMSLENWRRSNVEKLISRIYKAVKAENSKVLFGISPQSSVDNNYSKQYLDVAKIAGSSGYCDYICPQIYFGYENGVQPYQKTLDQWSELVSGSSVKLYIGLASYKVGVTDSWAGSGKNEWTQNTDLLTRMVKDAREAGHYQGFVLYRYDSIFNPGSDVKTAVQKENKNLKALLS